MTAELSFVGLSVPMTAERARSVSTLVVRSPTSGTDDAVDDRRFTRGNVRKVLLIHSVNPYYDPLVFVTAFTPMIITCQRLLTYPHTDLLTYPPT
jgi:hypothetical protein